MQERNPRDFDGFYDVIIVGGRPAGASLAAHLGSRGVKVLVMDRTEPSAGPSVPSCPVLYPSSMRLLDELGVDERLYGVESAKLHGFVLQFVGHFQADLPMPEIHGRDYVCTIERPVFDTALWNNLARYPSVEARTGFSVTELLRDGEGTVIGVAGHAPGGKPERLGARCVVGADGRYSPVAHMAGAKVREEQRQYVSSVYFTDWEGLSGLTGPSTGRMQVILSGKGHNVLVFPYSKTKATLCAYVRADHLPRGGFDAETFYREKLESFPEVREAIKGAHPLSRVLGMKRVENGYREMGGPGWVLVGDALHYKDPGDGQGIYDALLESKLLAALLVSHVEGKLPWSELLAAYERQVLEETRPMYLATMQRLKQELYTTPPPIVIRTVLRWMLNDPEYQHRFVHFLSRAIHPSEFPPSMGGIVMRGLRRDLRALFT